MGFVERRKNLKELVRSGKRIMLDDEDLTRVLALEQEWNRAWCVSSKKRVLMFLGGGSHSFTVYLARFILNYSGPLLVDHIDRNTLNNQKYNLRVVTRSVNNYNTCRGLAMLPKLNGINWHSAAKKWQVIVRRNGESTYLGLYRTTKEAVAARDKFLLTN